MFTFSLNNYRCFKRSKFSFSKINILIGENNSGKSSLLKFLLCLKQSLNDQDELNLQLNGPYADLGNYKEAVYYHSVKRDMSFGFELGQDYVNYYRVFLSYLSKKRTAPSKERLKQILGTALSKKTKVIYKLSNKLSDHNTVQVTFHNAALGSLTLNKTPQKQQKSAYTFGGFDTCNLIFKDINGNREYIENIQYGKKAFMSFVDSRSLIEYLMTHYGNLDIFYKVAFLLITQNYIEDQAKRFRFVNPINSVPERFYFEREKNITGSKITIDNLINLFGNNLANMTQRDHMLTQINEIMIFFGIADGLSVISDSKFPVIELKAKIKDLWSNLTDVGYGVGLQIPIILQAIISEGTPLGETILIEQPEVHLHPKLQAKFIETLLRIGRKNVYFIETHSEHIVRKLQAMVKQRAFGLKPEDISIYYFTRDTDCSKSTLHKIDIRGQLTPGFPSGFFDSSYLLAKELIK